MLLCSSADIDEVPCRTFEQNVGRAFPAHADLACLQLTRIWFDPFCIQHFFRSVMHFAFPSTHHACKRERTLFIANQNVHRGKFSFNAIKGGQFFSILRSAGDDLYFLISGPRLQNVIIERVQGLPQFKHRVIGRIDDVIDRAHAGQFESALDLVRAGLDLDISN